ncbi:MAG: tripartite tricarboxylate transporter TctB family protein [Marinovum sp.]|nr:tripartite tricarboxylate transporter TctB family protein [Marinovum sp.]
MSQTPASKVLASRVSDTLPERHGPLRDLVTGALSVLIAIVLGASHFNQGGRLHEDYGAEPGPALLPELLLAILGTAGIVLIIRGVLSKISRPGQINGIDASESDAPNDFEQQSEPAWAFLVLASTIAFGLLQTAFGFGIAAAILGAILCATLAYREGRPILRALAEGIVVTAVLYGAFRLVLSVPLT